MQRLDRLRARFLIPKAREAYFSAAMRTREQRSWKRSRRASSHALPPLSTRQRNFHALIGPCWRGQ